MHIKEALISTEPQVLFDRVVERLVAQGRKAVQKDSDGEEQCVYNTVGGERCALGHCLTDEGLDHLHPDSGSIKQLLEGRVLTGASEYLRSFLNSLQNAHDLSRSRVDWVGLMRDLAQRYVLSPKKLDEVAVPAWAALEIW